MQNTTYYENIYLDNPEHDKEICFINFSRSRALAYIILFFSVAILYADCLNFLRGDWISVPGYKILFVCHLSLVFFVLAFLVINIAIKPQSADKIKRIHHVFIFVFALGTFLFCAVISGWIDQTIHGEINAYIIACYSIAITYYSKPIPSLILYILSFFLFIVLVTIFQNNPVLLRGHYINSSISVVVCYALMFILYRMKKQDLITKNYLEDLVSERTAKFQETYSILEQEISLREQIVENLKQSNEKLLRLASIFEYSNDGIIGMTMDGTIIDWNKGACKIFGYDSQEIVGKSVLELIPSNNHETTGKMLNLIAIGQSIVHNRLTCQNKKHDLIDVSVTASPIRNNNGDIMGVSAIARDISEQSKFEKEMFRLDRLSIVGEMAASISHEVKNPMTTIKGFLQLLSQKEYCDQYKSYFDLMISEVDRATSIINEFLSISRNKATFLSQGSLSNIVTQMLPLIVANANNSDIIVVSDIKETPSILLDEKEIRQVILNLTLNGLESMSSGGTLTIGTYTNNDKVVLYVKDSGPGISYDVLEKIGTPFFSTKDTGTGLGLAVCYGIVERHNGLIEIDTNEEGTTFTVFFNSSN